MKRQQFNTGEWLSVKSFTFPKCSPQKSTIVYTSLSLTTKGLHQALYRPNDLLSKSHSVLPNANSLFSPAKFEGKSAKQQNKPVFKYDKLRNSINPATPDLGKPDEIIRSCSIAKKPLHQSKRAGSFQNSFIKNSFSPFSALASQKSMRRKKIVYLKGNKLRLLMWIPQPDSSPLCDLSKFESSKIY